MLIEQHTITQYNFKKEDKDNHIILLMMIFLRFSKLPKKNNDLSKNKISLIINMLEKIIIIISTIIRNTKTKKIDDKKNISCCCYWSNSKLTLTL